MLVILQLVLLLLHAIPATDVVFFAATSTVDIITVSATAVILFLFNLIPLLLLFF